jgi:hypothetical protein
MELTVRLKDKLHKLEGSLEPKQKVLLFMEQVDNEGGLLEYALTNLEEPNSTLPGLASQDAHFLVLLIKQVNLYVLAQGRRWEDTIWLAAFALRQAIAHLRADLDAPIDLDHWRQRFVELNQEFATLQEVVRVLSETYLDERIILHSDMAEQLKIQSGKARTIAEAYNDLPSELHLQPITPEQLKANRVMVDRTVQSFCNRARADALEESGMWAQAGSVLLGNLVTP